MLERPAKSPESDSHNNNKPAQASWWIIGRDSAAQERAVAVDLRDAHSELCTDQTHTHTLGHGEDPEAYAIAYAQEHGIPASEVFHDEDSTEFYKGALPA